LMLPVTASLPNIGPTSDEQRDQLPTPSSATEIPLALVQELWSSAGAKILDLTIAEFGVSLGRIGDRLNFGEPAGVIPDTAQQATFLRGLRLGDLALATACALGRDRAWQWFLETYRGPLTQAAIAITRSVTLGLELADSLYAELYGLRSSKIDSATDSATDSARRSPLASYSGRGSLMGWLRTTLAQRHVDHHRRTHRETPLDATDAAAPEPAQTAPPEQLVSLKRAIVVTLRALGAEDRFLLSAYFLDQRTLLEIARILHVHEATVSRRIKRLSHDLREELLRNLKTGGLSAQAAEEALGTDPRDLEINLRRLLQTSRTSPFSEESEEKSPVEGGPQPPESGQP
jgi:RNA polymerase sigma-70 factor (ECF subfamily)